MNWNNRAQNYLVVLLVVWTTLSLGIAHIDAAENASEDVSARQSGAISGRVSNQATNVYLEGALLSLQPSGLFTLTDRDGRFVFSQVPPGNYTLSASYTGLETQAVQVDVNSRGVQRRDFDLTAAIYKLGTFVVSGEREGNALALTQQRNSISVKNVVSADAFGTIADQSIGNLLVRIPGLAEEMGEGDINGISIRGVSSDFNAVTVDGTRGASANASLTRGFALDRIPADFVERIEVSKALTPDLDADAIGGTVNLRTKSPLDRKGRNISYAVGTSYNVQRETFRPQGSFQYSDIYGAEQKLGVLVTSSYSKTHRPREVIYQNWQNALATDVPAYFYTNSLGMEDLNFERFGLGMRVDYKLSPTHRIYLNTMYSGYHDTMLGRLMQMGPSAAQVRPGWTDGVTESFNHDVSFPQDRRTRSTSGVNTMFGGEKRFESSVVDYGVNYSYSHETQARVQPQVRVRGVGFRFDRSKDITFPTVTQISGPDIYNRDEHQLVSLRLPANDDLDTIRGAQINWKREFGPDLPANFKTGLRYRGQKRDRSRTRQSYGPYVGPDGIAGRNPATGINDDNVAQFADPSYQFRTGNGRYDPMPAVDFDRLLTYFRANPAQFPEDIVLSTREALNTTGKGSEEVYAAYAMGEVRLGRLDIMAGVRVEETRLSGSGVRQEITPEEKALRAAWIGPVTPEELKRRTIAEWGNAREYSTEYRNVLPSIHFKYNVTRNTLVRASYSTGIGRPNFSNILQNTIVNNDQGRVTAANPDLRPQTVDNFDVAFEYYFEPAGLISADVFLKEIKDFIYGSRDGVVESGPDNGFGGDYAGYDLSSTLNGGSARIRGFELAYNQRFSRLPGAWQGFGLMANYTRLESLGNYSSDRGVISGRELAGFIPETYNVGISYAYASWDVRVKHAYRCEHMNSYNADPSRSLFRYPKKSVDVNLKYHWNPRLSIYVDVINVFDEGILDDYVYIPTRVRQTQLFKGPQIKTGISGRF